MVILLSYLPIVTFRGQLLIITGTLHYCHLEVYYELGDSIRIWPLNGEPYNYVLKYVVNKFSIFYLVTILNEFMYY